MDAKNDVQVMLGGKLYTITGFEEENYIQRVASYINNKQELFKKQSGFLRQSADFQSVMMQLNIADDYFKAQQQASILETKCAQMEKEIYQLKHELVSCQMKLDAAVKEAEDWQQEYENLEKRKRR